MKTLVVYYSRGGATRKAAEKLREITKGTLFEVRGEKNYGNYFSALRIAGKEFKTNELPKVMDNVENFNSYDRILIGFPIWYSKCPQLILSFAGQYDFAGKDVYPFCTSGMSGAEDAVKLLAESCKGAVMHPWIRMNNVDDEAVKNWLEK